MGMRQVVTQPEINLKLNDAIDKHPTVENYEKRLSEYCLMGRYRSAMNHEHAPPSWAGSPARLPDCR